MEFSDFLSAGAFAVSLIAIFLSIRADRRSAEKHEYELETTWKPEWRQADLSTQHEIRFRCDGPRQIHRAWIDTDSLFMTGYAPHIVNVSPGVFLSSGDTISFTLANLENISALPDQVRIEWQYVQGKTARAWNRLRRLFAPLGYADVTHYENVDLSGVLHELQSESTPPQTRAKGLSQL